MWIRKMTKARKSNSLERKLPSDFPERPTVFMLCPGSGQNNVSNIYTNLNLNLINHVGYLDQCWPECWQTPRVLTAFPFLFKFKFMHPRHIRLKLEKKFFSTISSLS